MATHATPAASPRSRHLAAWGLLALAALGTIGLRHAPVSDAVATPAVAPPPLPELLSQTGLYRDPVQRQVDPELFEFSPQYPLWSDGTTKRRWLRLPPGTAIDASRSEAWQFPPGTRLWKEFAYGRPVETRMIERLADGTWRFSAYVWNADGSDAVLAPESGIDAVPLRGAPVSHYVIPSQDDCRACHDGAEVPVLGVSALQLSPDRDPLAPHASPPAHREGELRALIARGWLRNAPASLLETPPRIAARSATERAALGYLHANCGHCHNTGEKAVPVRLALAGHWRDGKLDAQTVLATAQAFALRAPRGADGTRASRIVPGDATASVLAQRMRSRHPQTQMPPIGTQLVDDAGLALVERWITELPKPEDPTP
ncbi:hypothetical protein [Luteimonas vadosa]|uniref:Cytochrome c domain-containing protein n=1 Tax=Luteimonas vadosa TaxID=1165507 RepID=A0ABP9DTH9_9GAMM